MEESLRSRVSNLDTTLYAFAEQPRMASSRQTTVTPVIIIGVVVSIVAIFIIVLTIWLVRKHRRRNAAKSTGTETPENQEGVAVWCFGPPSIHHTRHSFDFKRLYRLPAIACHTAIRPMTGNLLRQTVRVSLRSVIIIPAAPEICFLPNVHWQQIVLRSPAVASFITLLVYWCLIVPLHLCLCWHWCWKYHDGCKTKNLTDWKIYLTKNQNVYYNRHLQFKFCSLTELCILNNRKLFQLVYFNSFWRENEATRLTEKNYFQPMTAQTLLFKRVLWQNEMYNSKSKKLK